MVEPDYVTTAFDGEGARLYGGHWNSPGTSVVYTAESVSLAALIPLVHLQSSQLLISYFTIAATFDRSLVEVLDTSALPADWRKYPAPARLQQIGDRWTSEQHSAVIQVPSALVPNDFNYILIPAHLDFNRVEIGPPEKFRFDPSPHF